MSQENAPPKRKPFQIYVPVHRRGNTTNADNASPDSSLAPSTTQSPRSQPDDGLVRRGRGRFRAPSSSPTMRTSSQSSSASDREQPRLQPALGDHGPLLPLDDNDNDNDDRKPSASPFVSSSSSSSSTTLPRSHQNDIISAQALADAVEKSLSLEPKEEWEELDDESISPDEHRPASSVIAAESDDKSRPSSSIPPSPSSIEAGTTVLECSEFPSSFKTYHIQDMFRIYEDMPGGFKIKWMDDTRALIIFGSANTAKRAYLDNLHNPQAKIRPYTGPVEFTSSPKGEPIPRRPMTTDMVARRLVHGALGMRRPVRTAEQVQAEQDMLQSVREKREAKRQQAAREAKGISDAFFG